MIETIVKALAQSLGLSESTIQSGIGILLGQLQKQGAGSSIEQLVKLLPGADALLQSATAGGAESADGGLLGGILSKASSLLGSAGGPMAGLGELAGAAGALQSAGIPLEKVVPLVSGFFSQAQEAAGPEAVQAVLGQLPGLAKMLTGGSD